MYGLANCLVSVLRGTTTDQWGDAVDNGAVAASGIPAFIIVRSRQVFDPSTQTPRTVQTIRGAVGSAVDIRDTDQILDETHDVIYAVESVTQPLAAGITPDTELELRRVK
jgi:hypothetical protein